MIDEPGAATTGTTQDCGRSQFVCYPPWMKTPAKPMPAFAPPRFTETKPDDLPRDPLGDAAGWSFRTLEHGQHRFPAAIEATDAEGRSCLYVPMDFAGKIGRWVKPRR